jgi:hypothetical protein
LKGNDPSLIAEGFAKECPRPSSGDKVPVLVISADSFPVNAFFTKGFNPSAIAALFAKKD